jgi:predicted phosphodiesterase
MKRIAVFGGIYSNHLALAVALADARRRDVQAIYCLGDLGAFGPHPDRVFPLLQEHDVQCIQGNYDHSIGNGLADCQCGYTDPRDNHFAEISYRYTFANTSPAQRSWMKALPSQRRVELGRHRVLMCHGSPRRTNEFLWESTTSTHFLDHLLTTHDADVVLATHTGIKWSRSWGRFPTCHEPSQPSPSWQVENLPHDRHFINVGVLGRPENDGTPRVWYTLLSADPDLRVEFVPIEYDHERLAAEMRAEKLPEEFVTTILTGWWTTCLEILPAKERRRGKF